jgi:hypothetical protein
MKLILAILSLACYTLLLGCESNFSNNDKEFSGLSSDSVSITGFTGDSVKLVKTASIQCKVKDVHQGTKTISALAKEMNGMITYSNIESREDQARKLKVSEDSSLLISIYSTDADITARIPSNKLEDFLFRVADIGYFTSNSKMAIDDKSLDYLASHLKQQNRIQFLKSAGNKNIKGVASFGLLETKDEAIENEIAKRQIDADVKYSMVQLKLYQNPLVRKEIIVNDVIEDYKLPFSKNLGNAFNNGWNIFLNFILALTHLWMFIIAGIVVWITIKYYSKRKGVIIKNE